MASAGRLRFARSGTLTPTLQNASDTFGAWTTPSRGGVRLNGAIGFIVSGTPTSWKIRMKPGGGTATHWTFPGSLVGGWWTVSEGTAALTPMPSGPGRAAFLSDGTYTFEVIGTDAVGDSNTVEFTRTIDPNAATFGNVLGADNEPPLVFGGSTIAQFEFGTTIGQRKLLLAKGIEERNLFMQAFEFTSEVVLRDADPAVKSNLIQLFMTWINAAAWTRFITVDGLEFDGTAVPSSGRYCKILIFKVSDIVFKNMQVGKTVASQDISLRGLVCESMDCERITIHHCKSYWLTIGFTLWGTDIHVHHVIGRWLHARLFAVVSATNILIEDWANLSPRNITGSGLHGESLQRSDGDPLLGLGIIDGMTIRRFRMYHADATWGAQGLFMGDTTPNPKNVQIYAGAYAGWLASCIAQSGCDGTNRMRNFTLVKADTGDDSTSPPGSTFMVGGPNTIFSASAPAKWTGTYDVDHGYVGDKADYSPPGASFATPNYDATSMRFRTRVYQAGDFLNGDPSVNLPLITFSQWEAMSDEDVIAAHDAALIPGPNLSNADYVTGAFLADGSWNENS